MEIRKINSEEDIYSSLVATVSYFGKMPENYAERIENPPVRGVVNENEWAGFDDSGRICSRMNLEDYKIHFDGHITGMCGVGGVATLPEHRNGGFVRGMFEKALPEMKERGFVFSYLYPFSYAFYRKFGYELCYMRNAVTIPADNFKGYAYDGNVAMYESGGDISGYTDVYNEFARGRNLSMSRDAETWERMVAKDPYVSGRYSYLHRDADSRADAYLLFRVDSFDHRVKNTLRATEIAWTTPEGLHALFGFLGVFFAQFDKVYWEAPDGLHVPSMFDESGGVELVRAASGMNRVVDVGAALRLLKVPAAPGRASVRVFDGQIESNTGAYEIEWADGASRVEKTNGAADLEIDIQTLTQLATGFINADEAAVKRGVRVNGNMDALRALFVRKDLYLMERF